MLFKCNGTHFLSEFQQIITETCSSNLQAFHSTHFSYSNYIFNTLTKCTYTIKYMNYYKHSPTCFSAYCAIFKENFLVCSKLLLHHLMTELKLYYNIQIIYNIYYITYYFLIYLLTPSSTVLLEKLTGPQLANKFPTFYGTRRFITALTSALHLSIS